MLIYKNISEIEAREFGGKEAEFQFQFLGCGLIRCPLFNYKPVSCVRCHLGMNHMGFLTKLHHLPQPYGQSIQYCCQEKFSYSESCACAWIPHHQIGGRVQLKCGGTRWRTGGNVKGKLVNGVGSQYSSHYVGTWCIQHYYHWCAHLGCQ